MMDKIQFPMQNVKENECGTRKMIWMVDFALQIIMKKQNHGVAVELPIVWEKLLVTDVKNNIEINCFC